MKEIIETDKLKQIISKIETIEQERLESADLPKEVIIYHLFPFLSPFDPCLAVLTKHLILKQNSIYSLGFYKNIGPRNAIIACKILNNQVLYGVSDENHEDKTKSVYDALDNKEKGRLLLHSRIAKQVIEDYPEVPSLYKKVLDSDFAALVTSLLIQFPNLAKIIKNNQCFNLELKVLGGDKGVLNMLYDRPQGFTLDLSEHDQFDNETVFEQIVRALRYTSITSFKAEECLLMETSSYIFTELPNLKYLQELHFKDNCLPESSIDELTKTLSDSSLVVLDISNTEEISIPSMKALASAIGKSNLTKLLMMDCDIDADRLEIIANIIPESKLRQLDLSNNDLQSESVVIIKKIIDTHKLEHLTMTYSGLSDCELQVIYMHTLMGPVLTKVTMLSTEIEDPNTSKKTKDSHQLVHFVQENAGVTKLEVSNFIDINNIDTQVAQECISLLGLE